MTAEVCIDGGGAAKTGQIKDRKFQVSERGKKKAGKYLSEKEFKYVELP